MRSILTTLCACIPMTGCTQAKQSNVEDAAWRVQFHSVAEKHMKQNPLDETAFSIELCDTKPIDPLPSQTLPFSVITCTPVLEKFPPGNEYTLYCPHTGCPAQPEFELPITINTDGSGGIPYVLEGVTVPIRTEINLYAIPGYTSDWYLIGERPFSIRHTTFTYQPILTKGPQNQELSISKKEPGGNLLKIELKGFHPFEKLLFLSNSEGEIQSQEILTDEKGSYSAYEEPQVKGKTKGIVTITVTSDDCSLSASSDWDTATLSIPRKQPKSVFRKMVCNKSSSKKTAK